MSKIYITNEDLGKTCYGVNRYEVEFELISVDKIDTHIKSDNKLPVLSIGNVAVDEQSISGQTELPSLVNNFVFSGEL